MKLTLTQLGTLQAIFFIYTMICILAMYFYITKDMEKIQSKVNKIFEELKRRD